jgi:hypothetical protein
LAKEFCFFVSCFAVTIGDSALSSLISACCDYFSFLVEIAIASKPTRMRRSTRTRPARLSRARCTWAMSRFR